MFSSSSGLSLETEEAAVDTCPERIHAAGLTVRGFFWCSGKKRNKKKKQELKAAAGECLTVLK